MQSTTLGVIGLGLIWQRVHRAILTEEQDFFIPSAFCDLSEARRIATAAEFPDKPVVADYQELLALPEIAVVQVLTPIAYNAPVALAALNAGKDVIMEKPIARSVTEGQALVATAKQLGRRLIITEQLAYRHAEAQVAALLAEGAIGEVILWERVQHLEADTGQGPMRYESTPWRKEANFPLGTLFDGGVHLIAGLSTIFGAPASVAATGRKLREEYGEYDQVAMLFHYANQTTGMLSHSSYLPATKNYFYIHGTEGVMAVEPGQIQVERKDGANRSIPLPQENAYARMWQAIVDAYRQGNEPAYTAARALQDVATLEAVAKAVKEESRVTIPALV
ncbi:MAG: Gfo/Idh/MocA family oxidoreductase [Caldilineaceae bacterium]|nr:Gfo/Idh/MocA family oxidoreductase [Caldilineaceae bacterium]